MRCSSASQKDYRLVKANISDGNQAGSKRLLFPISTNIDHGHFGFGRISTQANNNSVDEFILLHLLPGAQKQSQHG